MIKILCTFILTLKNKSLKNTQTFRSTITRKNNMGRKTITLQNNQLDLESITLGENGSYDLQVDGKRLGLLIKRDSQIITRITEQVDLAIVGNCQLSKLIVKAKGNIKLDAVIHNNAQIKILSQNIEVNAATQSQNIDLAAKENIQLNAAIKAEKISIRANKTNQNGICKATKKLKIESKHFDSSENAMLESNSKFILLGNQVDSRGCYTAKGLAFFSAKTMNISGQFKLPSNCYLHAASLHIHSSSDLNIHGENATIEIDKEIKIDKNAKVNTENTWIKSAKIQNAGSFTTKLGKIQTDNILNQGDAIFDQAQVNVKYRMVSSKNALTQLNNTHLMTKEIETKTQSTFTADHADIEADVTTLDSLTDLKNTHWKTNYFQQNGNGQYHHSKISFKNQYELAANAKLQTHNTIFQGEMLNCDGDANLANDSIVDVNDATVDGKLTLVHSEIKANKIMGTASSQVKLEDGSELLVKDSIRLNGKNHLVNSDLISQIISMEGETELANVTIEAKETLRFGRVKGEETSIHANVIDYLDNHEFTNSSIKADLHSHSAQGNFIQSEVKAKFDTLEIDAKVSLEKSSYASQFTSSAGHLSFDKTTASANNVYLHDGSLSAQQSEIDVKHSILTKNTAKTNLSDSKLEAQTGYLQGEVNAIHSDIVSDNLSITHHGNSYYQETNVTAKEALHLDGQHEANESFFNSDKITINGDISLENKSRISSNNAAINKEAKVTIKKSILETKKILDIFGELDAKESEIRANDLLNYKKLKASQANIKVKNNFSMKLGSETQLEDSKVSAQQADFHEQLDTTNANVVTEGDINFHTQSKSKANNLFLESKKNINIQSFANITGDALTAKADEIYNYSKLSLDKRLGLDANYVYNQVGDLHGGDSLEITAARAFMNNGGSVFAKNTTVKALASFNLAGDICGQDSLTATSLFNLNAGTMRGYDITVNNVIDLNAGLMLPTLPSSLKTALNTTHLISSSKMLLTNFIPGSSKVIGFTYSAVPLAYGLAKKGVHYASEVYSVATSAERKWSELTPTLPTDDKLKNARLVDSLDPILSAKSMATSYSNLYDSYNEIAKMENPLPDFSKDIKDVTLDQLMDIPFEILGPSITVSSVASANAGVVASANTTRTDMFSANVGVEEALLSHVHDTKYMLNAGIIDANKLTMTGVELDNLGYMSNKCKANINFDNIHNHQSGSFKFNHATVKADNLANDGSAEIIDGKVTITQNLTNSEDATLTSAKTNIDARNFINQGRASLTETDLTVKNKISAASTSSLSVTNGKVKADSYDNAGDLNLKQAVAEIQHGFANEKNAKTNFEDVNFHAGSISNSGEASLVNGELSTTQDIINNKDATFTFAKANVNADNLINHGTASTTETDLTIKNKISATSASSLSVTNGKVKADSYDNAGDLSLKLVDAEIQHAFTNEQGAKTNLEDVNFHAGSISNSGEASLVNGELSTTRDIINNKDATFTFAKANVNADNLINHGTASTTETDLTIKNKISATSASSLSVTNGKVKADSYDNAGDLSLKMVDAEIQHAFNNEQGAKTNLEDVNFHTGSVSNSGKASITASTVTIDQDLENHLNGDLQVNDASIKAENIKNDGSIGLAGVGSQVNEEGKEIVYTSSLQATKAYMQSSTGKLESSFGSIESETQSLDGNYAIKETDFIATDKVDVKESAMIDIGARSSLKGKNIDFSATATNHDVFTLAADEKLTTTATAKINGDEGVLIMTAKQASIKGEMTQSIISAKADHIDEVHNLIAGTGDAANIKAKTAFSVEVDEDLTLSQRNQRESSVSVTARNITVSDDQHINGSYHLDATQGDVKLNAHIHANLDLIVTAANDVVTTDHDYRADRDIGISAGHSVVNNGGRIVAERNNFIEGKTGQVKNIAGTLQGKNYVQVVAKEGVVNETTQEVVQLPCICKKKKHCKCIRKGRPRKEIKYHEAAILGGNGDGLDNGGIGVVISTDSKFTNIAATVSATGKASITAKQGVDSRALTHTYLESKKTTRSGLFKQHKHEVKTYNTAVKKGSFSAEDTFSIVTPNGGVNLIGTDLVSGNGTTVMAAGKIEMYDVIGRRKVIDKKSGWWGATCDNKRSRDDFSVAATLASRDKISLYSTSDDIYLRGIAIATPKKFSAEGENVTLTSSKLRHQSSRTTAGINVSLFGQTIFNSHAPKEKITLPFANGEATYNHLKALTESNGIVETGLNSMNAATSVANTGNGIVQGIRQDDLLKEGLNHFDAGNINPSVKASYTVQKEKSSYESLGEGSVNAGRIELTARSGAVTLEAIPVDVAGDMKVKAEKFIQKGKDLKSRFSKNTSTLGVGVSAKSATLAEVSANQGRISEKRNDFINQHLTVGGNLEVNANTWEQDGANADVGSLSGQVEEHKIKTHTNKMHSYSYDVGASTTGEVNAAFNEARSKLVSETAGVNIRGTGETQESNSFHANKLVNKGGVITGSGDACYQADQVVSKKIHEYNKSTGFSVSGNVKDVTPQNHSANKTIDAKDDEAKQIQTLNLGLARKDYRATQHAVVDMQEKTKFVAGCVKGKLVNDVGSGKKIKKDESHNYKAEIPILDEKTVKQMKDNAQWAKAKVSGTEYSPRAALGEMILAHEPLNTREDVEEYVDKIRAMEQLSEAVYKDAEVPSGFRAVDEGFVNSKTDANVVAYINEDTNQLVFAFRGTASFTNVINDNKDLAMGKAPRSFDSDMQEYIETVIQKYPQHQPFFTGHSLGGADAALASHQYGHPAYAFDNPGINNPEERYDFSRVTSFQGTGNIVNHAGSLLGRDHDKGNVIQLAATSDQRMLGEASKQLGGLGEVAYSTYNHKLGQIKKQLEDHFQKQLNKANIYGEQANRSVLFQPKQSELEKKVVETVDVKNDFVPVIK